jgi:thiosulfate/3-mercaptopyruvate sulfurtransferase
MYEDIVVSTAWVNERWERVRIVDVREPWEFEGIGHLPNAVNLPFDAFRAGNGNGDEDGSDGGDEGMLPGEETFADLLGEQSISREDEIVAYDDTHGVFAARLLVTCELYGHDPRKLHLLNGDFSAWSREFPTSGEPAEPDPTTYAIDRPAADETVLISREAVADALDASGENGDVVIVDTREEWEYAEGHLPGAVRLDWRELVDGGSRGLKSDDEMEAILAGRGITPAKRVILYCNTARRISHTYLALRHLGYEDLAFYEGSLTEWEREGGPIEKGEAE